LRSRALAKRIDIHRDDRSDRLLKGSSRHFQLILLNLLLCGFIPSPCDLLLFLFNRFGRLQESRQITMNVFKLDEAVIYGFRPIKI